MKNLRIIFLLCLLFASVSIPAPNPRVNRHVTKAPEIQYQTRTWINNLTLKPSRFYTQSVNTLVRRLKITDNWQKIERLWIHATEQQQHARVSLINPTSTAATEVNSPTWTQNRGYTGDGATTYLNLNFTPSSAVLYQQNSASLGVYSLSDVANTGTDMGCFQTQRAYIFTRRTNGTADWSISGLNSNLDNSGVKITVTDSRGFFAISRASASNFETFKNGLQLASSAVTSNGRPGISMYLLCQNAGSPTGFSNRQIALSFVGNGTISQANFYSSIQAFAQGIGFAQ